MAVRWPAFRLVERGWATLGEIDAMTFDQLELANLAADAIDVAREGQDGAR